MNKIFGYDWEDIKLAQQGDMSGLRKPVGDSSPTWTEEDQKVLDQYKTIEALEQAGMYGVLDRAKRLGII